ncbi:MAG: DEAD/DEAH box helicase [Candidatus Baldrarchaeia archaeon]
MRVKEAVNYGLDGELAEILTARGVMGFNAVQSTAVKLGVFRGRNVMICSPSASGKSLLGEIACINSALSGGKAAYIVPLKSVAYEKYDDMVEICRTRSLRIVMSTGDFYRFPSDILDADVMILTYEKFDSMTRQIPAVLDMLRTVVIDEVHMLSDPERGPRLEGILTRLRLRARKNDIQMIPLSASIGNPHEIASWLNCALIESHARMVPLEISITVTRQKNAFIKEFLRERCSEEGQVLVFVARRRDAESLAEKLGEILKDHVDDEVGMRIRKILDNATGGDRSSLARRAFRVAPSGVCFHHAGLSLNLRRAIELAFRKRLLKVLVCTTTLSAGINMPARYVILRDLVVVRRTPDGMEYRRLGANTIFQIVGRAGRPGFDSSGHAYILVYTDQERELLRSVLFRDGRQTPRYENVESQLENGDLMEELLLVAIYDSEGATIDDLVEFLRSTLWGRKRPAIEISRKILLTGKTRFLDWDESHEISGEVVITKADGRRIEGIVNGRMCTISRNGAWCECSEFSKMRRTTPCRHLVGLAMYVAENLRDRIGIVLDGLGMGSALDFLMRGGLVKQIEDADITAFEVTRFGELVIKLYLRPRTAVAMRALSSRFSGDVYDFIRRFCGFLSEEGRRVPPQLHAALLEVYEGRISVEEIPVRFEIPPGDFEELIDYIRWSLHALRAISELCGYLNTSHLAGELLEVLSGGSGRD